MQVEHPRTTFNPNVWRVASFLLQMSKARSSCRSSQLSGSGGIDPNVPGGLPPWSAHLSTISRTHSWGTSLASIPSKVAEYYLSEASKCLPWCCSFMHPSSCSERLRSQKRQDRLQMDERLSPQILQPKRRVSGYKLVQEHYCKTNLYLSLKKDAKV